MFETEEAGCIYPYPSDLSQMRWKWVKRTGPAPWFHCVISSPGVGHLDSATYFLRSISQFLGVISDKNVSILQLDLMIRTPQQRTWEMKPIRKVWSRFYNADYFRALELSDGTFFEYEYAYLCSKDEIESFNDYELVFVQD